jgi:octaprenyl-diphosphate synthase
MSEHTTNLQVALSSSTPEAEDVLGPLAEVSKRNDLDILSARLVEMRDWLSDELVELEEHIGDVVHDPAPDIAWEAADYLLQQPGKRVRPVCVMLAARMGGLGFTQAVRDIAIACELVHNATLLHDDVIDQGTERRGAPTSRLIYGNAASVLGGDHMLIEALRRVNAIGMGLQTSLLEVIAAMVSSEVLQLELRRRFRPERALYLQVVEGKTASLFRWALEAGATVAGLSPRDIESLGRVGRALGMTFQLVDDLLDIEGDPEVTGKAIFTDLLEGKLTWPLILGSERSPEVALRLRAVAATDELLDESTATELVRMVRDTGAIEDTRAEATRYAREAESLLETLPEGRARAALETVVETALHRCK